MIALIFSIISLCTSPYHVIETHPNEQSFHKRANYKDKMSMALWHSYQDASDLQGTVIGISGLIGLILGAIALIKAKSILSIAATGASVIALIIVLATKTHLFS